MSWNPLHMPLGDVLVLHARIERLRVVNMLSAAEMHLKAAGMDPAPLMQVRRALLAQPIETVKPIFAPPAPPPADAKTGLRYLRIEGRRNG